MSYVIEPVDINDPEIDNQLRWLIKEAFNTKNPIPAGHLYRNTVTEKASQETLFLAAMEDGKIIGCNGFLATDFIYNGSVVCCYQSCWSATHPQHQGKKIFVNIINEGKKVLKDRNAGFIYGVPNNNSYPIFIKKLGFKEIPATMVKIPNIPIIKNNYFENSGFDIESYKSSVFLPCEDQISDLKKNISENEIIEINEKGSYLWGKMETKPFKFGIRLKYFYIGGIQLEELNHFRIMIDTIFSRFKVHYIQIVSCESNLYNRLLRHWKPAQMNGFIFYELNSVPVEKVNIFYGAIDVF